MDRSLQKKANFFCQYIQEWKWMNHSKLTIRCNGLSLSIPWEKYGQIVLNNILIGVMVLVHTLGNGHGQIITKRR